MAAQPEGGSTTALSLSSTRIGIEWGFRIVYPVMLGVSLSDVDVSEAIDQLPSTVLYWPEV